jgi:hypothetical protein
MTTQAVHCGFVCQAGAGAGLVEGSHHCLLSQHRAVFAISGDRFQLPGYVKNVEKLLPFEILQ